MAWISELSTKSIIIHIFVVLIALVVPPTTGLNCGYPGSPAFGRPVPVRDSYSPGSKVTFNCAHGYTLRGTHQKTCLDNGTWTDIIPVCDQSLPGIEQHASSPATHGPQFGAENVIDGNRNTCTYTAIAKPRYIRVELRRNHLIEAVAISVPQHMYKTDFAHFIIYVISVQNSTTQPTTSVASYHKCAEFNGKFSTTTVKLPCATGGFFGKYVHIQDRRIRDDYFCICEIDIFVQKDSYECGEPDRPSNSYTSNPEAGVVEYRCLYGYKLEGAVRRRCLANGQWSGNQPLCLEIVCPSLPPTQNGIIQYTPSMKGKPTLGTTANVTCDYGYTAQNSAIQCLENGHWSDGELKCQPVDCHVPEVRNEIERYMLLNRSTTYGSMAVLYCGDDRPEDSETLSSIRICREDGIWTAPTIDCVNPEIHETLGLIDDEDAMVPKGIIIGMAVVVGILLVILIFILRFRRKQLSRRQSAESLPSKDTSSSLTASEAKNGVPYENDAFYASITVEDPKHHLSNEMKGTPQNNNNQPPVVERGILSTILFAKRKASNNNSVKQKPRSESTSSSSSTCFYEEIGLHASEKKSGKQAKKGTVGKENTIVTQPVYAQVDFDKKRRSRLAKSESGPMGISSASKEPVGTYRSEEAPCYDSELDLEPVTLRELPPTPDDDDDQSSGTYASLSRPPEPPPPPSPVFMRNNSIYGQMDNSYDHHIMKDNEVYSTT